MATKRPPDHPGRRLPDPKAAITFTDSNLMTLHSSPSNGRTVTTRDRQAFEPRAMARSHDEELGYRRGFDQGVAALAQAIGLDGAALQQLAWKQRVRDFRAGRLADSPFFPTPAELTEIRTAVRQALQISS